MAQFKVGDIVEVVTLRHPIDEITIGEVGNVVHASGGSTVIIRPHNKKGNFKTYQLFNDEVRLVTTPPDTIQHEGYNYTRGEPVAPEWLKDGAWVVHKETGELNQLIAGDPGYFKAINKKTWYPFVLDFHPSMTVSDFFRPFTNADWKWGMWAEYKGEKVFVMNSKDQSGYIEISKRPIHNVTLSCWTTVPSSELTPTTAP